MQAATQTQVPTPPANAPAPAVSITTTGPGGTTLTLPIPRTSAEVRDLRIHSQELTEQLAGIASRRRRLSEEIRSAPDGASRTGLEDRVRLLDQRILQLETDIAATGRQLSAAPAELIASTQSESPPPNSDDWEEGMAFGVGFMLLGMAIVYVYRRFRRRRSPPAPQASMLSESAQRLERLEHGVEAIAIEVERISEGQRFVTKLFSEAQRPIGTANRIAQPAAEAQAIDADARR
jgi:hypothetical protein